MRLQQSTQLSSNRLQLKHLLRCCILAVPVMWLFPPLRASFGHHGMIVLPRTGGVVACLQRDRAHLEAPTSFCQGMC